MTTLRFLVFGRSPKRTLVRAALIVAVCFVVFRYLLLPVRAQGASMQPTYASGSFNLINTLAYRRNPPRRGDVVAIRLAGPQLVFIKRIVALPGETVRIDRGLVLVDEVALEEPYVKHRWAWDVPATRLGANEFFVVGDNRAMRPDDHGFGRAQRARIVGRLLF